MMELYGALFRKVFYPVWEANLRGRSTPRLYAFLDQTQWRSLDEILAIQAGELQRLLRHLHERVPYYRAKMKEVGMVPSDVRSPADLGKFPLLTRELARETVAERTALGGPPVEIHKSTGGTLGRPLVFGYDAASEHWRQACKFRGYRWAGYRLGSRVLHYWAPPMKRPAAAKRAQIALDRMIKRERYVDCTVISDRHAAECARIIATWKPEAILCFAQAGAHLARAIVKQGLRTWRHDIPVLCGAERLLPADRQVLEEAFGREIYETYGCREVMLIASECEAHDGMHLSSENLVVEILVREGNGHRPARPGEMGEVAVTDLHNYAMPFVRYTNGDLAIAGSATRCRCGRALPRISGLEGRVAETLTDGEGNRVSGLVFNVIFVALADAVRQFQVVQHRDHSITLKLVPSGVFDPSAIEAIKQQCRTVLKGVEMRTEVVQDIPLTAGGKRQVVFVEK